MNMKFKDYLKENGYNEGPLSNKYAIPVDFDSGEIMMLQSNNMDIRDSFSAYHPADPTRNILKKTNPETTEEIYVVNIGTRQILTKDLGYALVEVFRRVFSDFDHEEDG